MNPSGTDKNSSKPGNNELPIEPNGPNFFSMAKDRQPHSFLIATFSSLIIIMILAFSSTTVISTRDSTLTDEMNNLRKLSRVLSEHVQRVVFGVDLVVSSLEEKIIAAGISSSGELWRHVANKQMHAHMQEMLIQSTDVDTLGIVGADGRIIINTRSWPTVHVNVSARKYFTTLRDNPELTQTISESIKSKITGQQIIILARRINAPDGSFLGLVLAVTSANRFQKMFAPILQKEFMQATLFHGDGYVLAQHPLSESAVEKSATLRRHIKDELWRANQFSFYTKDIDREITPQLLSLNSIRGYPLMISLTKDEAKVLAKWKDRSFLILVFTATIVLLVLLMGIFFIRQSKMSAQHFRRIFEESGIGMAINDVDGKFIRVNKVFSEMLGCSRRKLLNRSIRDVIFPEDVPKMLAEQEISGTQNTAAEATEHRFIRDDGEILWGLMSRSPIMDSSGKPLYFVSQVQDISERRQAEEVLSRSHKMDAVGQLTGGIAHDFNNILAIVKGNLDLIHRKLPEDSKAQERVGKALKGVSRGEKLTRKLLDFSRMAPQEVSITSVNNLLENLKDLISKSVMASIHVETSLAEGLWPVAVDDGDFENVMLNLSLNARDAMPEGGTLTIKTANKTLDEKYVKNNPGSSAGDFVAISIIDTGVGMDKQVAEKMFEPFFTTKEQGLGTGLGLSMVYGFVQRSGGHLKVYSQPLEGTTIHIYLPRADKQGDNGLIQSNENSKIPHGTETILIVDDEEELLDVSAEYLNELGYKTITAKSGREALQALENNQDIDLLLSDIIMPGGLDGYQLALEAHRKYPSLNIMFASGFTKTRKNQETSESEILAKLAISTLSKPYTQSELATSVRRTLDVSHRKIL